MSGKMNKHVLPPIIALVGLCASVNAAAQQYWENDPGGIFNPPPAEYNPIYFGYGSSGTNVIYNKIDLQDGRSMHMDRTTLYDNTGGVIGTAWESGIGRVNGERDGGLIAGSIYSFIIDGEEKLMTYAWSVNSSLGSRQSGWIDVDALSPRDDIVDILRDTKFARLSLFDSATEHDDYRRYTIQETRLPAYMEEYYLDPGREATYSSGKALYYYSRDGYLTLLKNIPETNAQRFGVAHDIAPEGSSFYRDMTVAPVVVNIYPPSSFNAESHTLNLVWGYTKTTAGEPIFSWVNERGLRAVDDPEPPAGTSDLGVTFAATDYDAESDPENSGLVRNLDTKVGYIRNGTWIRFDDFNFASGAETIEVSTTSPNSGGTIELRTGSASGPLIGSVDVARTGSWFDFAAFQGNLTGASLGVEDLYLVFVGNSRDWLFDIETFEIN